MVWTIALFVVVVVATATGNLINSQHAINRLAGGRDKSELLDEAYGRTLYAAGMEGYRSPDLLFFVDKESALKWLSVNQADAPELYVCKPIELKRVVAGRREVSKYVTKEEEVDEMQWVEQK